MSDNHPSAAGGGGGGAGSGAPDLTAATLTTLLDSGAPLLGPPPHSPAVHRPTEQPTTGRAAEPADAPSDGGIGSGRVGTLDGGIDERLDGRLAALDWLARHTERLAGARGLDATLTTLLDSGASLLGAGRALLVPIARDCADAGRPQPTHGTMVGLALDRAALGALETVPTEQGPFAGLLRAFDRPEQLLHPDLTADLTADLSADLDDDLADPTLGPRFREVAASLGIGACFALPLATEEDGPLGAAVWFYEQPTVPGREQQELARRYCAFAAPLLAGRLDADRRRRSTEALRRGLLPDHLPYVPGLRLAARWVPAGLDLSAGSDWYDAIALPDGSVGLSVGSVSGDGPGAGPGSAPGAATAMGRVRAALRAYAVLEGEDPVSVLGDLELLLKTTEPARTATAVYACVEPAERRIALAGAGHCPPLLVTRYGAEFVETSLSAPLGMLACWEAPGVELNAERGDLLLLYTEGLARRCGSTLHAGQANLRKAAADAPREVRQDPDRLCAHLLTSCVGSGDEAACGATDDLVLLAARFE
ncbi:serine phosphatase RsbU (regulator of sigma subunit) [Kitasatospora sp. MAP12-15]|uniref:PP2C family protein-serine/threonine phosphatase n=1 Tax=unclassified Kitasatospora TaxID=2633591 RepID=UPI002476F07F|nr:PP2C family protein-serine/threonine phosphatase [Kitasatospora sp. MAP12-44]MDH6111675.1 serine phosphatase RsbU (regulator of sigma subunit) [Kitasatospora sp. MAP12-44]